MRLISSQAFHNAGFHEGSWLGCTLSTQREMEEVTLRNRPTALPMKFSSFTLTQRKMVARSDSSTLFNSIEITFNSSSSSSFRKFARVLIFRAKLIGTKIILAIRLFVTKTRAKKKKNYDKQTIQETRCLRLRFLIGGGSGLLVDSLACAATKAINRRKKSEERMNCFAATWVYLRLGAFRARFGHLQWNGETKSKLKKLWVRGQ